MTATAKRLPELEEELKRERCNKESYLNHVCEYISENNAWDHFKCYIVNDDEVAVTGRNDTENAKEIREALHLKGYQIIFTE